MKKNIYILIACILTNCVSAQSTGEKAPRNWTYGVVINLGVDHPLFKNMTEQPYGVDLAMKSHKMLGAAAELGMYGEYKRKFGYKAFINLHGFSFDHDTYMKAMEQRYTGLNIDDDRNGDPTHSTISGACANGLAFYGYGVLRAGKFGFLPMAGVQVDWVKFTSISYGARQVATNYFNQYIVDHQSKFKLLYAGGLETRFYYTPKNGIPCFLSFTAKIAGNKLKAVYKVTSADWQDNKTYSSFSYTTPFVYTTFLIGIGSAL